MYHYETGRKQTGVKLAYLHWNLQRCRKLLEFTKPTIYSSLCSPNVAIHRDQPDNSRCKHVTGDVNSYSEAKPIQFEHILLLPKAKTFRSSCSSRKTPQVGDFVKVLLCFFPSIHRSKKTLRQVNSTESTTSKKQQESGLKTEYMTRRSTEL